MDYLDERVEKFEREVSMYAFEKMHKEFTDWFYQEFVIAVHNDTTDEFIKKWREKVGPLLKKIEEF